MFFPFLYFSLLALAVVTQLSAWLAARRRDDLPRWARWGHATVLLLLFPAMVLHVGGTDPMDAGMLPWGWVLGALFLASAGLSVRTAHRAWRERLCAWGIAFNCAWFGLVQLLQHAAYRGVALPTVLQGLLVAHAMTMSVASIFLYIFFPVLSLWPLAHMAPPRPGLYTRILNGLTLVVALLLVGFTLGLVPRGTSLARRWQAEADTHVALDPRFRCGVVVRIRADALPDSDQLARELEAVRQLGAQAVNVFVHPAIIDAPVDVARGVGAFTSQLRADGRTVIVTADYPSAAWLRRRPCGSADVQAAMAPFHRFLLEHLPCDIFVPYIEPYGAFVAITGQRWEPDVWVQLLSAATHAVRANSTGVRTAAYVGQGDDDEALYACLLEAEDTVDVLGISIYSLFQAPESIDQQLARVSRWLAAGGAEREHWIFEFGQSPLTMGGERAQAGFILHVLDWAAREDAFRGACVFALADYAERAGLVASNGRRRHAWTVLHELVRPSKLSATD